MIETGTSIFGENIEKDVAVPVTMIPRVQESIISETLSASNSFQREQARKKARFAKTFAQNNEFLSLDGISDPRIEIAAAAGLCRRGGAKRNRERKVLT